VFKTPSAFLTSPYHICPLRPGDSGQHQPQQQPQPDKEARLMAVGDRVQWQRVVRASTSIRHQPLAARGGTAKRRCGLVWQPAHQIEDFAGRETKAFVKSCRRQILKEYDDSQDSGHRS